MVCGKGLRPFSARGAEIPLRLLRQEILRGVLQGACGEMLCFRQEPTLMRLQMIGLLLSGQLNRRTAVLHNTFKSVCYLKIHDALSINKDKR